MNQELRILILDDHQLFREGLVRLLESEPGVGRVAGCEHIDQAIAAIAAEVFDVVLLDFDLGVEDGLDFLGRLRKTDFGGKVMVLTAGVGLPDAQQLMKRGAAGIIHKNSSPQRLLESLHRVMAGEVCLDAQYARAGDTAEEEARAVSFTERDRQVLRAVFEGLGNKEIGMRLQISEPAVKASLQQLFNKTGVRTRSQLVRVALERYRNLL